MIYGLELNLFFQRTGLTKNDLWDVSVPGMKQTLWNAKLHPVVQHNTCSADETMTVGNEIDLSSLSWITKLCKSSGSLSDEALKSLGDWKALPRLSLSSIRALSNAKEEFKFREDLTHSLVPSVRRKRLSEVKEILLQQRHEPCMFDFVVDGYARGQAEEFHRALILLDKVIVEAMNDELYNIVGRSFMVSSALISDIADSIKSLSNKDLGEEKEEGAPQRSLSPSTVTEFRSSINELRSTSIDKKRRILLCQRLFKLRNEVLSGKEVTDFRLASEQMELAAAALTELCITGNDDNSKRCILHSLQRTKPALRDNWVVASAPGRIDVDGGWSDTPPISYDYGGAVLIMACTVDGRRPLSSRCRIVSGGKGVVLRTEARESKDGKLISDSEVKMNKIRDIADFRDPSAACTLLKCALLCLGFVSLDILHGNEDVSLQPYINSFCSDSDEDVGLEIISTSLLPRGSGMGGSSILGGCVLASIAQCVGFDILSDTTTDEEDDEFLIHGVLMIEQLLTTGGGWQDQIGGLIGGIKLATSVAHKFPLEVKAERRRLDPRVRASLNKRLVLAFSGQPRLAKTVLQHVLRRWARRTPEIVANVEDLVINATKAAKATENGDIDAIGRTMYSYWLRKKKMAGEDSGVEPIAVADLLKALLAQKEIIGGTLIGAGGGGFLVMVASEGRTVADIERIVKNEITDLHEDVYNFTWHECAICEDGLKINVIDKALTSGSLDDFQINWHD